jgi:hypothetical protein
MITVIAKNDGVRDTGYANCVESVNDYINMKTM